MMVEKVDLFLLGLSNLVRLSVSENIIIIMVVFFLWFYLNKSVFLFPLLHSGSPSLHNPGFQSKKNLPHMDEALVFHLLHHPNFPTLLPPPPKKPTTLWNKPPCDRVLKKQKTHDGHHRSPVPPGDDRSSSSPNGRGEAVDLRFFFAERRCCGSNFRMETTIVPVTGTCTIWGPEAQGDFFFVWKNFVLVVVGLAVFGVFDIYFFIYHIIIYHVSYIISSYIKSYITYHMSISHIIYHASYIIRYDSSFQGVPGTIQIVSLRYFCCPEKTFCGNSPKTNTDTTSQGGITINGAWQTPIAAKMIITS